MGLRDETDHSSRIRVIELLALPHLHNIIQSIGQTANKASAHYASSEAQGKGEYQNSSC